MARGSAYLTTLLSKGKSPTANRMTRGKRNILWYQHNTQGANSITLLKNKLPRVEMVATSQHRKSIVHSVPTACSFAAMNELSLF
jgi:hypothetical protein